MNYVIVCPSEYERKKIIENVLALIHKKEPDARPQLFDATVTPVAEALEQLYSPSLFSTCSILILDNVDKWKKAALESLAHYIERPSPHTYLILGSSSAKPVADLRKKEVTLIDLSNEKPWEKQKRLKDWLVNAVKKAQKSLSPEVADLLIEELGTDLAYLEQELAKLICFAGDRPQIIASDAKALLCSRSLQTSWQLAEAILFKKEGLTEREHKELSFLLPLAGQIRYHLQMGFKATSLLEQGVTPHDLSSYIPSFKSQHLDKYRPFRSTFFKRGLQLLFDWELKCKSTSTDPAFLFDLFTAKLHALSSS